MLTLSNHEACNNFVLCVVKANETKQSCQFSILGSGEENQDTLILVAAVLLWNVGIQSFQLLQINCDSNKLLFD